MPIQRLITFAKGLWSYQPGAPEDSLFKAENVQLDESGKLEQRDGLGFLYGNTDTYTALKRAPNSIGIKAIYAVGTKLYFLAGLGLYKLNQSFSLSNKTFTTTTGSFVEKDYLGSGSTGYTSVVSTDDSLGDQELADVQGSSSLANIAAQGMKVFETEKGDYFSFTSGSPVKRLITGSSGTPYLNTAGLPAINGTIGVNSFTFGTKSYIYYFHYYTHYWVNGKQFAEFGPIQTMEFTAVAEPSGGTPIELDNIKLPSTYNDGWPSSQDGQYITRVAIYRTKSNGSVPYFVGTVSASTYNDVTPDANLPNTPATGFLLPSTVYTLGGVEDDSPIQHLDDTYTRNRGPQLFTIANNCGWYGRFFEYNKLNEFDVIQSKPLKYGTAPGSFRASFKEVLVGLSHIDIYPIVFSAQKCYRVEGIIDESGAGTHNIRIISDTVGLLHDHTIVRVGLALYFISQSGGIYRTDGYRVEEICSQYAPDIRKILLFTVPAAIKGTYDTERNTVQWIFGEPSSLTQDTSCENILEINLNHKDNPVVIRFRHYPHIAVTSSTVPFSAITAIKGMTLLGTNNGYLFKLSPNNVDDIGYDSGMTDSQWWPRAVVYDVITSALSFGNIFVTKWVTKLYMTFKSFYPIYSNLSAKVSTIREEDQAGAKDLKVITETATAASLYEVKRWIPRLILRSRLRQFRITRPSVDLYTTADYGNVNITGTSVVLVSGTWPTGIAGQNFKDNTAGITRKIVSVSGNTIVLSATISGTNPRTNTKVVGFKREDKFRLEGLEIEFNHVGESIEPYKKDV